MGIWDGVRRVRGNMGPEYLLRGKGTKLDGDFQK